MRNNKNHNFYILFKHHQDESEIKFESFDIIKEIGDGAFGQVYIVKKKDNG